MADMRSGFRDLNRGAISTCWPLFRWGTRGNSTAIALRGCIAIVFGTVALFLPATALFAFVVAFGAYAFVDGLFALTTAFSAEHRFSRWSLLLEGITGMSAAAVTFFTPRLTALALLYVIAVWALLIGIFKIANTIRHRKQIRGEGLIILSDIAPLLLGIILFVLPLMIGLVLISVIGVYGIVVGILLLRTAVRIRGLERTTGGEIRRAA